MKKRVCVLLITTCIFVFVSCKTNAPSDAFEQTEANSIQIEDSIVPDVENDTTLEEIIPEETTPEETTPEEITPEVTTSQNDDTTPPEKPNIQLPVEDIIKKLEMFESIFQEDSREWQMYKDITGSAVTSVLNQRYILIKSGCDEADVLLAGQATENLRVLLEEYNDLREDEYESDDDKYIALYQHYVENYRDYTQNFCDLYKTLKRLYENQKVSQYIKLMGKSDHYRQLVGHLYVISTALDTNTDRDEDAWQIDGKGLCAVIEDVHYFPDGNWAPEGVH